MTNEEAIKQLEITKQCDVDTVAQIKALNMAIVALRNCPTGEPLTLEQLREMDGQPVRMEDLTGGTLWNQWIIFERHTDDGFIPRGGGYFGCDSYGVKWLAYAYPPAHIDREAWVSVEERLPGDNERVIAYRPNEADVSAYKYCVMWGWSVKMSMKHRGISHWMPLPEPPDELEKRMGVR